MEKNKQQKDKNDGINQEYTVAQRIKKTCDVDYDATTQHPKLRN